MKILHIVHTRHATIVLNCSIKNVQTDVRNIRQIYIFMYIYEKSQFNSLVWGSLTIGPLILRTVKAAYQIKHPSTLTNLTVSFSWTHGSRNVGFVTMTTVLPNHVDQRICCHGNQLTAVACSCTQVIVANTVNWKCSVRAKPLATVTNKPGGMKQQSFI